MHLLAKALKLVLLCSFISHFSMAGESAPRTMDTYREATTELLQHPKGQLVATILKRFEPAIVARHGETMRLRLYKTGFVQASGGFHATTKKLEMKVHSGVFDLSELHVATAICHELGHALGDLPYSAIPNAGETTFDVRDSVEGEADYFGGKCMRILYGLNAEKEIAITKAYTDVMAKISNRSIGSSENLPNFTGINPDYPAPECRVLSFKQGLTLGERPKCWYNP